jgi:hypothetical protein
MIEQLAIDPTKMSNGLIWFNTTDRVYKAFIDEELHVFLTDKSFVTQVDELVDQSFKNSQFVVNFIDASSIIIKHNKNSRFFNYQLVSTDTDSTILTTLQIIDDNEVRLDLVDPLSGSLFMHFA